jgi:hypothetical protein
VAEVSAHSHVPQKKRDPSTPLRAGYGAPHFEKRGKCGFAVFAEILSRPLEARFLIKSLIRWGGWPTFEFLLVVLSRLRLPHLPRFSEGGHHGPRLLVDSTPPPLGACVKLRSLQPNLRFPPSVVPTLRKPPKRGAASVVVVRTESKDGPASTRPELIQLRVARFQTALVHTSPIIR